MTRVYMSAKDRLTFADAAKNAAFLIRRRAAKALKGHREGDAALLVAHAAQLDRLYTMLAATPANVDAECTIAPVREAEAA
jgi:hypothetical protein